MLDSPIKVATKWLIGSYRCPRNCSRLDNLINHSCENQSLMARASSWSWVTKTKVSPIVVAVHAVRTTCLFTISNQHDKGSAPHGGWLMMARAFYMTLSSEFTNGTLLVTFQLNHLENFRYALFILSCRFYASGVERQHFQKTHSYVETRHRIGRPYGHRLLVGMSLIRTHQ